jgi:hypothetical protein
MDNLSTKQSIALIAACVVLVALLNVWGNWFKQNDCERAGGRFIKNLSDSTMSTCIMGR